MSASTGKPRNQYEVDDLSTQMWSRSIREVAEYWSFQSQHQQDYHDALERWQVGEIDDVQMMCELAYLRQRDLNVLR